MSAVTKTNQPQVPEQTSVPPNVHWMVMWLDLCGKVIEKLGFPGFLLFFTVAGVKLLGSPGSQDKFIRDLLWADNGPFIQITFGLLVLALMAHLLQNRVIGGPRRDDEMERLIAERNMWQERALKMELAHSQERGQS